MRRRAFLLAGLIVNIGVGIFIASFPLSTGIHWFSLREMGFRELAGLVVVFLVYLCGPISAIWAIAALLKRQKESPPKTHRGTVLRCSFCNKAKDSVPRLIAGPNVFICDECVEVCNDVLAEDTRDMKQAGRTEASHVVKAWPNPLQCALCRAAVPAGQGVVIAHRGTLCVECVGAVRANDDDGH